MQRSILAALMLSAVALLSLPSTAGAWGAVHRGYTHVGPNGAYHVGTTNFYGGYHGGYGGYHPSYGTSSSFHYGTTSYGGGSMVHYGSSYSGYHYAPSYYGGASYNYMR